MANAGHFRILVVVLSLMLGGAIAARPTGILRLPGELDKDFTGDVWALLIAGSAGWGNYRHQADVLHAYQVLRRGGVPEDHIVLMIQDDLAHNEFNPHPGKIFNKPRGPNVYEGVKPDYTGEAVNAQMFLDVLAGNKNIPRSHNATGKVIKSGPNDRVFVYFSDHGAPGILGMPNGPFLYADQFLETLRSKSESRGFADMVVYIEACESGSIFEGLLSDSLNIYATTAANAQESSWGTYCPGMDPAPPVEITTCLGDLYSVAFLENSDKVDLTKETLEKQYELVKQRTSNNFTYNMGSHVLQFGALVIDEEPVADYLGQLNTGASTQELEDGLYSAGGMGSVPQRDADLLHLYTVFQRAPAGAAKVKALAALNQETGARAYVDKAVRDATTALLKSPPILLKLQERFSNTNLLLPRLSAVANGAATQVDAPIVEQFVSAPLPRAAGLPLVDDWDCLRGMVGVWEGECGSLTQYGMQYTRLFANLCNAGLEPASLRAAANVACSPQPSAPAA
eukprot:jgi/Botrbrau1/10223/Bobra.0362s0013.1